MAYTYKVGNTHSTGAITEIALSAATVKTVLQVVTPATTGLKVIQFGIYFDGTSATAEPVLVSLIDTTGHRGDGDLLHPGRLGEHRSSRLALRGRHDRLRDQRLRRGDAVDDSGDRGGRGAADLGLPPPVSARAGAGGGDLPPLDDCGRTRRRR